MWEQQSRLNRPILKRGPVHIQHQQLFLLFPFHFPFYNMFRLQPAIIGYLNLPKLLRYLMMAGWGPKHVVKWKMEGKE
jgi:hypothetical protein